ncbi:hypothetical protein N7507_009375 [Penicillium longicatenatum]|nr:hypothetical protein N7507_009375 [Penicillium longicatenatum]
MAYVRVQASADITIINMKNGSDLVSLPEVIRHNRELLVNPLFWTSRQLNALRCHFQHIDYVPVEDANIDQMTRQRTDDTPNPKRKKEMEEVELFSIATLPNQRIRLLSRLLLNERRADLFFAGGAVHQPSYIMFCCHVQTAQSPSQDFRPLVGYIDSLQIDSSRRRRLLPHPHPDKEKTNDVCQRVSDIKVARATPQEWTEDPYLLCVLISIAQFQERTQKGSQLTSQTSHLLVTNGQDKEFIHLYEGQFTTEFLRMLDEPTTARNPTNAPTINRRKIPYKPFETFVDRIQPKAQDTG